MTVNLEVRGDVAVISIARPPVNSLDWATRCALSDALERVSADARVRAVVVTGGPEAFSAGADIKEFAAGLQGDALKSPTLAQLTNALERMTKPVVAAIAGTCMGGGLELALACHARIATGNARLALPEINLGLLPGAGGTQRLPRLIGVDAALAMILSGEALDADRAAQLGLVGRSDGDLLAGALEMAGRLADAGAPRRVGNLTARVPDGQSVSGYFDTKRAALRGGGTPAAHRCLDAVRDAVEQPLQRGLQLELEYFCELMQTKESKALQYAFFGDRLAASITAITQVAPRPIQSVGIVGAGTMGAGIALCTLGADLPTVLLEQSETQLEGGLERIRSAYEAQTKKGRLSREAMEGRLALLEGTVDFERLRDCDLVIEAVYEDLEVKRGIFRRLDAVVSPGTVLASNTSTLDLNQIAAVTTRPAEIVGLHFFSPANVMRLLEVVRGSETAPEVLATAMTFARKIRKVGVIAGVCDGFIGNRMFEEYLRQAYFLLDQGVMPWQVDTALESWGMAMGPFAVLDLAGGDVGWAIRKRRALEHPERPYSKVPDRICELGRFGQKTGAGWYTYNPASRSRQPDPLVEKIVRDYVNEIGRQPQEMPATEIVERCLLALVNEGAKLLSEGIAQRASDIDVVYRNGYGFPPYRGGPMYYADTLGLETVITRMEEFQRGYQGWSWEPAPLLREYAGRGASLTSIQGTPA